MASNSLVLIALVLASALAFSDAFDFPEGGFELRRPVRRCGQYIEYGQVEISHGILLRGGSVLQFVGVSRLPGFRLMIGAYGPRNLDELVGSGETGDDTTEIVDGSAGDGMRNEIAPGEPAESVAEKYEQLGTQAAVNRVLDEQPTREDDREFDHSADDALRNLESTFAMVYPFLFSDELSGNHMDRLVAARARAVHAMSNPREDSYEVSPIKVTHRYHFDDDTTRSGPFGNTAAFEASSADVVDEASPSNSFDKFVQNLKAELGELCDAFADWWVGLPLYPWLLMVVSLVTIVFSAVVLCVHFTQRCCEDDEETAMILSCSAGAGVKTPLLETKGEDAKDAMPEAETKTGHYVPPVV